MDKKKPITFKCSIDLLREVEEWRNKRTYPVTLTSFIETAMRQALALERERSETKRAGGARG